jgi:hypothetical protein
MPNSLSSSSYKIFTEETPHFMRPSRLILLIAAVTVCQLHTRAQEFKYDAQYLSLVKEYSLNADGSMDYRLIKEQKLVTYRAFHNLYGETFIVYNPEVQSLKINEAYTTMADGKKVVAPENSFNEVLPGYAAGAPAYNGLREMVVTHTGLERNSVVRLDYTLHTRKGELPALMGNELLSENEPVKSLEIRVRIPAGQTLYHRLFNSPVKPVQSVDGTTQVFTWQFADLPVIPAEDAQPGTNERYPRLIFSTSENRREILSFITSREAFTIALPDALKKVVSDIRSEKKDPFEAALKIQEEVVNDVKFFAVPLRVALYTCRTPEMTWNSNGGTAIEKAVLIAAMLREAGFEADVAGVIRTAFFDEKIATLADIEDVAVKVETRDRGAWYMSVSGLNSVNLAFTLPGRSFVILKPGGKPEVIKTDEPKQVVKLLGNFIVSSDPKLTGEISVYCDGSAYPLAGVVRDWKKLKSSITGSLIGADSVNLKKSTINTGNGFQTWTAASNNPFKKDSNYFFFILPTFSYGIDNWGIKTLTAKRDTPYEIASIADESCSFTIALPAGFKLFTPEKKVNLSNKAGTFNWEVKGDDGKVTVKRQLKLESRIFKGALYDDFKALMDGWNNPWYREVIFYVEK